MEKICKIRVSLDINRGWYTSVETCDCQVKPDESDILIVTEANWSGGFDDTHYIKDQIVNRVFNIYNPEDAEHIAYEAWCEPKDVEEYIGIIRLEIKKVVDERYKIAKNMYESYHMKDESEYNGNQLQD
jgi:hypothetical protein